MMEENQNKQTEATNVQTTPTGLSIVPSATQETISLNWKVVFRNTAASPFILRNCAFQVRYKSSGKHDPYQVPEISFTIGDNGLITIPAGETVTVNGTLHPYIATQDMDVRFGCLSPSDIYVYGLILSGIMPGI